MFNLHLITDWNTIRNWVRVFQVQLFEFILGVFTYYYWRIIRINFNSNSRKWLERSRWKYLPIQKTKTTTSATNKKHRSKFRKNSTKRISLAAINSKIKCINLFIFLESYVGVQTHWTNWVSVHVQKLSVCYTDPCIVLVVIVSHLKRFHLAILFHSLFFDFVCFYYFVLFFIKLSCLFLFPAKANVK